jgi:dienelactone hydrolase
MAWKRRLGLGCGILLLVIVSAALLAAYFQPWMPALQMAAPGESGRRITANGLTGNYFPGPGEGRHPAILLLGGSEGGLGEAGKRSALGLQKEGFTVLQLAYYRAPGQPRHLRNVQIEYFGTALAWLARQPEADPERLAIIGASKGAEAALLLAARHPAIDAVVAGMPSSVVWPAISWIGSPDSSWSENGRPMPSLPFGGFSGAFSIKSLYDGGLARLVEHPEAVIPVERSSAPILLICGEADNLWPSCTMARQVRDRARKHGRPPVTLLAYGDAGHSVMGQPWPPGSPARERLGRSGGTNAGNNAGRADSWPRILAFLNSTLKVTPPPATAPPAPAPRR